jgi:hypothetical protein
VGDQPRLAGPWLPISYAVGGRQDIAVSTGNSLVSSGLNTLAPELHSSNASKVFVFALPETI